MTPEDYINMVVGKPWKNRAEGPDEFDCWGIVIDSFRKIEGIEVPQVAGYANAECTTNQAALEEIKTGQWSPSQPSNGAIMVAKEGDKITHVGRVLGGGVLHALGKNNLGSVKWSPFRTINKIFTQVGYYALNRT